MQQPVTNAVSPLGGGEALGFRRTRWREKENQSLTSPPPNQRLSGVSMKAIAGPTAAISFWPENSTRHLRKQSGETVASLLSKRTCSAPADRAMRMPILT